MRKYLYRLQLRMLTHNSPKVFGVKFGLKVIRRFFTIEIRNIKLWQMPKLLNFRFPEG